MGVEIKRNEKDATVINPFLITTAFPELLPEISPRISLKRWYKLVDTLYGKLYLNDWKKNYKPGKNEDIKEGQEWTLEITLTDNRKIKYQGDNAYPPYWNELCDLLEPLYNLSCETEM